MRFITSFPLAITTAAAVEVPPSLVGGWMVLSIQDGTATIVPNAKPEILYQITTTQRIIEQNIATVESVNFATDQAGRSISVLTISDAPTTWSVSGPVDGQFSLTINFINVPQLRHFFAITPPIEAKELP